MNRLFVPSFESNTVSEGHSRYFLRNVKIKAYNVTIDGKNFFDQPVKKYLRTNENIWKIETVQGDDYTTGCLLDYNYFKKYYKMIAIDLSKQQALDADLKAMHQINFTWSLDWDGNTTMFFIIEEAKETVFTRKRESIVIFIITIIILSV